MTNEQLDTIKVNLELISNHINDLVIRMNDLGKVVTEINNEEQPEEFMQASVAYSQAKNNLTTYLLNAVDSLGLTLLDVIAFAQSTPKAKIWIPS